MQARIQMMGLRPPRPGAQIKKKLHALWYETFYVT